MASRRNVQYSRLSTDDYDDIDSNELRHDPRFDYSPKHFDVIPWRSIALALFLLLLGSILLCLSILIFTGHMGGEQSQAYGLLGLGIVSFLPGKSEFIYDKSNENRGTIVITLVMSSYYVAVDVVENQECNSYVMLFGFLVACSQFSLLVLWFLASFVRFGGTGAC